MAGAKGKLCKELIDEICTYIENGLNNKDAATMAHVTENTLYLWLRQAEEVDEYGKPPAKYKAQRELKEAIKKARVAFKAYHVQSITKSSKKNWQASAWLLERYFPEEYGRVDRSALMLMQSALNAAQEKDDGLVAAIKAAAKSLNGIDGDEPEDV